MRTGQSTLLRNAAVLRGGRKARADILIRGGKIAAVGTSPGTADEAIDLQGRLVMPGLIDSHVHFRDFDQPQKEDWANGSRAAAAGGITTVLDMPNNSPPMTTAEQLEKKRKLAKKSIVNYGFHMGSTAGNALEIKKARNIASVKIYMNMTTGSLLVQDETALEQIFCAARMVSVHAEGEMIRKAIMLANRLRKRLYICHVSSRSELDDIETLKSKNIFAEVTPHHLFLNETDHRDAFTKMIPALKSVLDNVALMQALSSGIIDTVATDHAPHTVGEKLGEGPPAGVPGCETMLALLLDAAAGGALELETIQKACCENPARIFGIRNKGHIKKGYDADLVVVDTELTREVDEDKLQTKCGWSPFAGRQLRGWPVMTFVNGQLVYDGEIQETLPGREVEYEEL